MSEDLDDAIPPRDEISQPLLQQTEKLINESFSTNDGLKKKIKII